MKLSLTQPSTQLALAALALVALAAPAYAGPSPLPVHERITPPTGHQVFLVTHAEGVQIYECTAAGAWSLRAPRAELYAENGKVVGSHYVGPTWVARDGSYVVGRRVDGVNVDPSAIDWLLLERDTSAAGAEGDRLAGTKYIQRVNTVGGRAPALSECDVTGETAEIEYSADYYFWK